MTANTLQDPTIRRGHLSLVWSAAPTAPAALPLLVPVATAACVDRNLTSRDMITLHGWMRQPELHGYCRMVIEVGDGSGVPEAGGYVLFYESAQDWASWGVAREADTLVVWHCASGLDRGRHATMDAALESLPAVRRGVSRTRDVASRLDRRSTVVRLA